MCLICELFHFGLWAEELEQNEILTVLEVIKCRFQRHNQLMNLLLPLTR